MRTWTPSPVLPLPSCSRGIDPNQSLAFIFYLCKYATIISVLPGAWSSSSSYSSSRYWHIVVRRHNCCCGCAQHIGQQIVSHKKLCLVCFEKLALFFSSSLTNLLANTCPVHIFHPCQTFVWFLFCCSFWQKLQPPG